MNVLVTGANGFVGRALCARLKKTGHDVYGLSRNQTDITQPFQLDRAFDITYHLAAYNITHIGDQNDDLYERVNVLGTRHVLEAVNTRAFVFLSTSKVYQNTGAPLTEESPLGPVGGYEQSKLKAEAMCRTYFKGEALVVLRAVSVWGEGQAPKAILPVFFQKAKQNLPLDLLASPQTRLSFVYIQDLVDALMVPLTRGRSQGVFNIASPQTISLENLAKRIIRLTHSSSELRFLGGHENAPNSCLVCAKAKAQLGWQAQTSVEQVLKNYFQNA